MCVYCVYLLYINTHTCMYIFKKMLRLYNTYDTFYMNINKYMKKHVNIFKIYAVCVCLYIYIINIHSTHTHLIYKQKLLFWMRLLTVALFIMSPRNWGTCFCACSPIYVIYSCLDLSPLTCKAPTGLHSDCCVELDDFISDWGLKHIWKTNTHTGLFLWIVGTFHRRSFFTVQTVFSSVIHLTGNSMHFTFFKKNSFCRIYKPFEIWGHEKISS